jgi:hypothetical protein
MTMFGVIAVCVAGSLSPVLSTTGARPPAATPSTAPGKWLAARHASSARCNVVAESGGGTDVVARDA